MTGNLRPLLLLSCLFLAGLAWAGWMLTAWQEADKRYQLRIGRLAAPYTDAKRMRDPQVRRTAHRPRSVGIRLLLAKALGLDLAEVGLYPVPWWAVLLCTGVFSLLGEQLIAVLLGGSFRLAAPLLWIFASRFAFALLRQRRSDALYRQFPDALGMIVRSVRVGIPVGESIRMVAREAELPTSFEFARVADQVTIGIPLDAALQEMAVRNRVAEYRFFATALSLQSQTGGGLAETLEGLADVIRKRVALRARGHALASEARTSAGVLAALPVLCGLALWVLNPDYFRLLIDTSSGNKILAAAIGMLGSGMLIMRSIISRSLS